MQVKEIDFRTAKSFIEEHHYSHNMPRGRSRCFGWFDGDLLFAVANYGVGVNMRGEEFLAQNTGLPVTATNHFELKRLCRIGDARVTLPGDWDNQNRRPLTRFLSICHAMLRASSPPILFVVSFSDPEHQHLGGIYQAANFISLGRTRAEVHYQGRNKEFIHRRIPYRRMQNANIEQAYAQFPNEMVTECEEERVRSKKSKITMEIEHRAAKKLLGPAAQTFRYSWQNWEYPDGLIESLIERTTKPKARWFLPLLAKHRVWLDERIKEGALLITKKGELILIPGVRYGTTSTIVPLTGV